MSKQNHPVNPPQQLQDISGNYHIVLTSAANLANLLPTSTVLAFNALIPPFSNNGSNCQLSHKFLTSSVVVVCAALCFLSSFTDSFAAGGKLYHGIATFNGIYIFNYDTTPDNNIGNGSDQESGCSESELCKFRIRAMDFVHAFLSLSVFLVFAVSNPNVQSCLIPNEGSNVSTLIMNLPLGVGVLSSFLFTLFPTTRRGIGYADMPPTL